MDSQVTEGGSRQVPKRREGGGQREAVKGGRDRERV